MKTEREVKKLVEKVVAEALYDLICGESNDVQEEFGEEAFNRLKTVLPSWEDCDDRGIAGIIVVREAVAKFLTKRFGANRSEKVEG